MENARTLFRAKNENNRNKDGVFIFFAPGGIRTPEA